jgi:hypothetical protein
LTRQERQNSNTSQWSRYTAACAASERASPSSTVRRLVKSFSPGISRVLDTLCFDGGMLQSFRCWATARVLELVPIAHSRGSSRKLSGQPPPGQLQGLELFGHTSPMIGHTER